MTTEEILAEHPDLEPEDIAAGAIVVLDENRIRVRRLPLRPVD